jgi:hypothetical protein
MIIEAIAINVVEKSGGPAAMNQGENDPMIEEIMPLPVLSNLEAEISFRALSAD